MTRTAGGWTAVAVFVGWLALFVSVPSEIQVFVAVIPILVAAFIGVYCIGALVLGEDK